MRKNQNVTGGSAAFKGARRSREKSAKLPPQKPAIGRVVHFVRDADRSHKPAIIITVWEEEEVNLVVFDEFGRPSGNYVAVKAKLDESGKKVGTWHWPERE